MPPYKTIVLELLQGRPELYEQLRSGKMLLTAMDTYAIDLKTLHEALTEDIAWEKPHSDPSQIASEAMELAIAQFQERLPSGSEASDAEPFSLDAAMNYIRRHTPPA